MQFWEVSVVDAMYRGMEAGALSSFPASWVDLIC